MSYFPAAPNFRLKVLFLVVATVLKMNFGQMRSTTLFIFFFVLVSSLLKVERFEMERFECCVVEHEQADIVTLSFSIQSYSSYVKTDLFHKYPFIISHCV